MLDMQIPASLNFKKLTPEDKPWVDELVLPCSSRSADFNFGSLFLWDSLFSPTVAVLGGRLIVKAQRRGEIFFSFPVGCGELAPAVDAILACARAEGLACTIRGVEEKGIEQLESAFPGRFRFEEDRAAADYIYSAEALATLSGKALHAKRNHINTLERSMIWRFETLERRHFDACRELLETWYDSNVVVNDLGLHENRALNRAFEFYEQLGLLGGALFVEDSLVAFTMGELVAADALDVHFEKADASLPGAYPLINREFARRALSVYPELKYINREEDMGLENLRRAKMSYRPAYILRKFVAREIEAK
ncbi:MAG: phosphatidylglycerol lysyltransferase domain-containing protein [Oscillospiraceae bacterium]|jgi:hypothetical protein|nr:phosphatidylglycerol lysyltransferase domain-containing protein [Oscillospiraceae bacterium]